MFTPGSFNDIGHWTYLIFAIINAIIVPVVYFLFVDRPPSQATTYH